MTPTPVAAHQPQARFSTAIHGRRRASRLRPRAMVVRMARARVTLPPTISRDGATKLWNRLDHRYDYIMSAT